MKIQEIKITNIEANHLQPRRSFDKKSLSELAKSIQESGLIQPIVVKPKGKNYSLIAGERRLRAFELLNRNSIPAVVMEVGDNEGENLSLIENIQRMDLSAIEEALAFQTLLANQKITQEELAKRLGKSQSAIANKIRLLQLNPEVITAIDSKKISERHGRALLGLPDKKQKELLERIVKSNLNVAQSERLVENIRKTKKIVPIKRIGKGAHIRLGINTINEALTLVKGAGIKVSSEESETDEYYQILIKIKK